MPSDEARLIAALAGACGYEHGALSPTDDGGNEIGDSDACTVLQPFLCECDGVEPLPGAF